MIFAYERMRKRRGGGVLSRLTKKEVKKKKRKSNKKIIKHRINKQNKTVGSYYHCKQKRIQNFRFHKSII